MKRRRVRIVPPPSPGRVVQGGILEAISEQEKAGRPVPPPITLLNPISPSLPGSTERYHDDPPPAASAK